MSSFKNKGRLDVAPFSSRLLVPGLFAAAGALARPDG